MGNRDACIYGWPPGCPRDFPFDSGHWQRLEKGHVYVETRLVACEAGRNHRHLDRHSYDDPAGLRLPEWPLGREGDPVDTRRGSEVRGRAPSNALGCSLETGER